MGRAGRILLGVGLLLAVSALAATAAPAKHPHKKHKKSYSLNGTLTFTLNDTSGNCSSDDQVDNAHWTGKADINDKFVVKSQKDTNKNVLNLVGGWATTFCPNGSDSGNLGGTVQGAGNDATGSSLVDWLSFTADKSQIPIDLDLYGEGDESGDCAPGPATGDLRVNLSAPAPKGGKGQVHVDKTLAYGDSSEGAPQIDIWTQGLPGCGSASTTDSVARITGDLTLKKKS